MGEPTPDYYSIQEDTDYDMYYRPVEWKELVEETKGDSVESPSHYRLGKVECIDYLKDNMPFETYLGYLEGNTKKYLHRWRYKKKPLEDLKKAQWYLNRLIMELDDGP
jgi:hypothetical protein